MKKLIPAVLAIALIMMILSSCTAPVVIPSMPPVADKGPVYTHEKAGFTMTFPEDWSVMSSQQIQENSAQTIELLKESYKDPAAFEKALQQNVPVAAATLYAQDYNGFNPNINVIVMDIPSAVTSDMVSFAKKALEEMTKQFTPGTFEMGEVQAAKIGGLAGAKVDMKQTQLGIEILQKQFYVSRNDRLIVITLSAVDAKDFDTLQKAVDNVRFK